MSNFWVVLGLFAVILLAVYLHGLRTMRREADRPRQRQHSTASINQQRPGLLDVAHGATMARRDEPAARSDPVGIDTVNNHSFFDSDWGGSSSSSGSCDSGSSYSSSSSCGD